MGWREHVWDMFDADSMSPDASDRGTIRVAKTLMDMPPADRIALARELLAGTGWVPARDVGPIGDHTSPLSGYFEGRANGWNACRAAMLGDDA